MSDRPALDVGDVRITAIADGTVRLPPTYYPGLDFAAHPHLLQRDGTYHFPAGCFLLQGDAFTIVVDAGIGPMAIPFPAEVAEEAGLDDPPESIASGGDLLGALHALGVDPGDVTTLFLTHLDADHVGWVAPGGTLTFPRAQVICSAIEAGMPPGPAPGEAEGRQGLAVAEAAGRLATTTADALPLADGVVARFAPGHTPGHYVVDVASRGRRARLLGDAVHHPLQVDDAGISFRLEKTPGAALRTRDWLLDEVAGRDVAVNLAHLPGLRFQRVIRREDGHRELVPYA